MGRGRAGFVAGAKGAPGLRTSSGGCRQTGSQFGVARPIVPPRRDENRPACVEIVADQRIAIGRHGGQVCTRRRRCFLAGMPLC